MGHLVRYNMIYYYHISLLVCLVSSLSRKYDNPTHNNLILTPYRSLTYYVTAFGQHGWGVKGWEEIKGITIPERAGFSFSMLEEENEILQQQQHQSQQNEELSSSSQPPSKRARH